MGLIDPAELDGVRDAQGIPITHGLRNELKDILICAQWRVRSKLLIERDIF